MSTVHERPVAARTSEGAGAVEEALSITNLHAWYGESHILHDVSLTVNRGEVVTLLGRNGAGRTTTLRAIMGLVGARRGSVRFVSCCPRRCRGWLAR